MNNILCWNVRGLNNPSKQDEMKKFILLNKIGLFCLVETKFNQNFPHVYSRLCDGWCVSSNFSLAPGGRILIKWIDSCNDVNF